MPRAHNLAGLSWYIDNHVVDSQEAETLRRLFAEGWIYLQTPDTVQVEQLEARDEATKNRLIEQRSVFPMPLGPAVLGHSLFGFSVFGSEEDEERIAKVHQVLWPRRDLKRDLAEAEENSKARSCVRDTLIVSTSIRYSVKTLVTNDGGILEAKDRLRTEFGGFTVLTINEATILAMAAVHRIRRLAAQGVHYYADLNLPPWPSDTEDGMPR